MQIAHFVIHSLLSPYRTLYIQLYTTKIYIIVAELTIISYDRLCVHRFQYYLLGFTELSRDLLINRLLYYVCGRNISAAQSISHQIVIHSYAVKPAKMPFKVMLIPLFVWSQL